MGRETSFCGYAGGELLSETASLKLAIGMMGELNNSQLESKKLQFGWRRRLPMLLQTEATECGLACLAMIASY
ncbi:hypothetical protein JBO09_28025, partial [Pseudomonas sp. PAMC 26818]|uniref:hypothetical protein n=1 Tax=Pseudomonas sp. PAMC 26818 TaxID=1349569 RepID=UPI001C65C2FC